MFALAQGVLGAGIDATLAISLGTTLFKIALATFAVFAGRLAVKLSGSGSPHGELLARTIETPAGAFILLQGLGLFSGVTAAAGA